MKTTNGPSIFGRADLSAIARKRDELGLSSAYVAASGPPEERLTEIWLAALNLDRVGVEDDFFELGGDSLTGVEIFTALEHEFDQRLPLAALVEGPTIRHLAAILDKPAAEGHADLLVALRSGGTQPPLFCIHELTGNVICYRLLASRLDDDQPVYGLQYPGQDLAEPPLLGLEEMAARYLGAIRSVQATGPYYLLGFSIGGVIAYEIARRLRVAGEEVGLLALLDAPAPGTYPGGVSRVALHAAEFLYRPPWTWPSYFRRRLRKRMTRQRKNAAVFRTSTKDGLGARLERIAKDIFPLAKPGYTLKPYGGRVVLFRCAEDIVLWRHTPEMGWRDLVAGEVECQDIPASHQDLMYEPAVDLLAGHLETCLRNARAVAAGKRDVSFTLLLST